jgi:hypothetical protein
MVWRLKAGMLPLPYAAGRRTTFALRGPTLIRFKGSPGRSCPNLMSVATDHPQHQHDGTLLVAQ